VLRLGDSAEDLAGISFRILDDSLTVPTTFNASFTEGIGSSATRALEGLTDSSEGTLARVSHSLQSLLDRYSRDILQKQEQLEIRRARLERQYASLESTLGKLQNQGQFLSAQLSAGQGARFGVNG
jgi:flagellar capping protein FliD